MSNIVGEGFDKNIVDQINVRQYIHGSTNRTNEIQSYLNNKTAFCRLVSSVDLEQNIRNLNLTGNKLAKKYVLQNGITDYLNNDKYEGISNNNSIHNNSSYGVGGLELGLKPLMGITNATIKTETRGSLRTATINIKANNRTQFDIIDILYLRLGFTVLLEWGNSSYFTSKNTYIKENQYSLVDEFLDAKYSYDDFLPIIQDYRIKSKGNYNALIGKVVNFNWSLNRDGGYDITLILRSLGDVIESLKTNILLPTPNSSNTVTSYNVQSDIIFSNKDSHEIGKYFYKEQQLMSTQKTFEDGSSTLTNEYNGITVVDFIKQTYTGNNSSIQYYVRLGHFLSFIQSLIPKIKNTQQHLIKLNTDIDKNIIYLQRRQISTDPRICLFKCSFQTQYVNFKFIDKAEDFYYTVDGSENSYGKIMNSYFNMNWILGLLEQIKDKDGKVPLYDLINNICEGWNRATGYFNKLEPIIDETLNEIKIIDKVPLPDRNLILSKFGLSTEEAFFDVYGYYNNGENSAGFIRDINFSTQIPSSLSTMITVGSTANGYVIGQDSTALSRMNNGLKDRIKPDIGFDEDQNQFSSSLDSKYSDALNNFNLFLINLGSSNINKIPKWDVDVINNYSNTSIQFLEYDQVKKTNEGKITNPNASSPNIGFLPFDLTLNIDGLSGMKIYQKFSMDTSFLPSNYPSSLEFLIKGLTDVISNNNWVTTIESLAIPKNPFGSGNIKNLSPENKTTTRGIQKPSPKYPKPSAYTNVNFKNIGLGNPSNDNINPTLLSDISKAAVQAGVQVTITTAVSGHSIKNPTRHSSGNAVDISIIDGIPVSPNANNRTKIDLFVSKLQQLGYIKNVEIGNNKSVLTFGFPNHNDHVHVSNKIA